MVPLLVAIPLLAGGGGGLAAALSSAATKAAIALGLIAFIGTARYFFRLFVSFRLVPPLGRFALEGACGGDGDGDGCGRTASL